MRRWPNRRAAAVTAALLCAALPAAAPAAAGGEAGAAGETGRSGAAPAGAASWDEAFATAGARGGLSLTAVVVDRDGRERRVRLFRDGEQRLRRDTDETEILVERSRSDEVYRVIRRRQGVGYRVHARNLYRIGVALDWSSLATLLARPQAPSRVVTLARREERTPFGVCRWKEAAAQHLRVCWSDRLRIPLSVEEKRASGWTRSLRIEELHAGPLEPAVFAAPADLREVDLDEQAVPEAD